MAQQYRALSAKHEAFIDKQHMFFVATAMSEGHVNLSPKGMDSLRVQGPNRLIWLNVTGSGNETAAHVQNNRRMTVMFCAFQDSPTILRIYGEARVIHQRDSQWDELLSLFPALPGAIQIFDLEVSLVQTSCGMSIPKLSYEGEREQLNTWAHNKGERGIQSYWAEKNQVSLDGVPSHIIARSIEDKK